MGADLYGYFCFIPQDAGKIIKKHINNLNTVLGKTQSVTYIREINKKKSIPKGPIDTLTKLGVDISYYSDIVQIDAYDKENRSEILEYVKGDLETLIKDDPLTLLSKCRDSNCVQRKVNGKYVDVVFAGEMTGGDEPEGTGYNILKLFSSLGFVDQFEKNIKWSKK